MFFKLQSFVFIQFLLFRFLKSCSFRLPILADLNKYNYWGFRNFCIVNLAVDFFIVLWIVNDRNFWYEIFWRDFDPFFRTIIEAFLSSQLVE